MAVGMAAALVTMATSCATTTGALVRLAVWANGALTVIEGLDLIRGGALVIACDDIPTEAAEDDTIELIVRREFQDVTLCDLLRLDVTDALEFLVDQTGASRWFHGNVVTLDVPLQSIVDVQESDGGSEPYAVSQSNEVPTVADYPDQAPAGAEPPPPPLSDPPPYDPPPTAPPIPPPTSGSEECGAACEPVYPPELCDNGFDDDADGFTDGEDGDCEPTAWWEHCSNGVDDDGDGYVDGDDEADCLPAYLPEDCVNGVDDDADGYIDGEDGDCADVVT